MPLHPSLLTALTALAALTVAVTSLAYSNPLGSNPLVLAVHHGDCAAAVKLVNPRVNANDGLTSFLAARMLDEGICVSKDPESAVYFYAHAADLGETSAAFDYAAKVGQGEGSEQSYRYAGELCRAAGLDPQQKLSSYALGYACTVRSVTSELLRTSLPQGAFRPNTGVAVVEFNPAAADVRIRALPKVGTAAVETGSMMARPLIDAPHEIESAWRKAVAAVPKPDASELGSASIELALDLDMTLEVGKANGAQSGALGFGGLMRGDIRPSVPP